MQLTPHTGTETLVTAEYIVRKVDATHTPHGDGNTHRSDKSYLYVKMQLTPHTGTETFAIISVTCSD